MPPATTPNTPPRIYISYRPEDGAAYATRIHKALVGKFGAQSVYIYRIGSTSSLDRKQKIQDEVDKADVMLVVITRGWLNSANKQGTRRLEDPNDPVVIEIEEGLKRDRQGSFRVITVLEDEQLEPQSHQLQPRLRDLVRQESVKSRGDFDELIAELIETLIGEPETEQPAKNEVYSNWDVLSRRVVFALVVLLLIGIVAFGIWNLLVPQPPSTATPTASTTPAPSNLAIGFLLDRSSAMGGRGADGRTYLEIASSAISSIASDRPDVGDWIGLVTAGGGAASTCDETDVVSGVVGSSSPDIKQQIGTTLGGSLQADGHTAYIEGFDEVSLALRNHPAERRILVVILASDQPSSACSDQSRLNIGALLDRYDDFEFILCAFTYFESELDYNLFKSRLQEDVGDLDCIVNQATAEQTVGYVNSAIESTPVATTPPTLTTPPTDAPVTPTTPAPTPTPLASPTSAPTATQDPATATATVTPQLQSSVQFTVFVDENSLTVYVPDPNADIPGDVANLDGLEFQVINQGNTQTFALRGRFSTISLAQVPLPACFRLIVQGTNPVLPSDCLPGTTNSATIASANKFWHINNQLVAFTLLNYGAPFANFPSGQVQESFVLPPPPMSTPTASVPPDLVTIPFVYSPESVYMGGSSNGQIIDGEIVAAFNAAACTQGVSPIDGTPLPARYCIQGQPGSPGTITDAIVNVVAPNGAFVSPAVDATAVLPNGQVPVLWQPAILPWLELVNFRTDQAVYDIFNTATTTREPNVIAIWERYVLALERTTGKSRNQLGWADLLAVRNSPNGWCDYGIPELECRRAIFYGQTDPRLSSTSLDTLMAQFYAAAGVGAGQQLSLPQALDGNVQQGVRDYQSMARHYASITTVFREYLFLGADYIDFVALDENSLIFINQGLGQNRFPPEPLIALYPRDGVFMQERPLAIANLPGITPEQRAGAELFVQFVRTPDMQRVIMANGFRPADTSIALDETLWSGCDVSFCGITPSDPVTILTHPPADVINAVQNSWANVRRQSDITLLFDVSGSMDQQKLDAAKAAAIAFVESLDGNQNISLITFDNQVRVLVPMGNVSSVSQTIIDAINGFTPGDPNALADTALFESLLVGLNQTAQASSNNMRAVVLLSDGADTRANFTLEQVLERVRQSWETQNPVFVLSIAYGDEARLDVLDQIGDASFVVNPETGLGYFDANDSTLAALLRSLSRYF